MNYVSKIKFNLIKSLNKKNDSERERSVTSYIAIILLSIIFYENIYILILLLS